LAVDAAAAAAAAAIAGGIQHRAATVMRSSSRSCHRQEVAAVTLFAMASAVAALADLPWCGGDAVARGGWTRPLTWYSLNGHVETNGLEPAHLISQ